jgi:UDP-N-acetylmuramoyl-tripeptide--D-alanyl-D-alanine ligase
MMLSELSHVVKGSLSGEDVPFDSVSIDSRTLLPGALFVALKGPNFDGHDYITAAREKGASAAMISATPSDPLPSVMVRDTRLALGELAAYWRKQFDIPLIAVTGSNGKTSVKEMLTSILGKACDDDQDKVLSTIGNLNNDLGVPLTLLRLREHHRYAVSEMGMNHAGELTYLAGIGQPDVALITNASAAHLEGLQTVAGVARAKGEIFSGVKPGGTAVINMEDEFAPLWQQLASGLQKIGFAVDGTADVTAEYDLYKDHSELLLHTPWGQASCRLNIPGKHNIANALAATAAAGAIGIDVADIAAGLENWKGVAGRLQSMSINGMQVINDSYNANPASIRAALEVLAIQPGLKVLVVGDMGELGEDSAELHQQAGTLAREGGVDLCLTLGEQSRRLAETFGERAFSYTDPAQLVDAMQAHVSEQGDRPVTILVKGSRAMKMERVIELLEVSRGRN